MEAPAPAPVTCAATPPQAQRSATCALARAICSPRLLLRARARARARAVRACAEALKPIPPKWRQRLQGFNAESSIYNYCILTVQLRICQVEGGNSGVQLYGMVRVPVSYGYRYYSYTLMVKTLVSGFPTVGRLIFQDGRVVGRTLESCTQLIF